MNNVLEHQAYHSFVSKLFQMFLSNHRQKENTSDYKYHLLLPLMFLLAGLYCVIVAYLTRIVNLSAVAYSLLAMCRKNVLTVIPSVLFGRAEKTLKYH